jgi:hypothetical protein
LSHIRCFHCSIPLLIKSVVDPWNGLVWFGFTDELRVIEPRIQRANEC